MDVILLGFLNALCNWSWHNKCFERLSFSSFSDVLNLANLYVIGLILCVAGLIFLVAKRYKITLILLGLPIILALLNIIISMALDKLF